MPSLTTTPAGWRHWLTWAAMWGMMSAVGYTLANIFLRQASEFDPFLVTAVKTAPTSLLAIPWLWSLRKRRIEWLPANAGLGWLLGASLLGQLGGNVAFQWSLRVIGMALAVPLSMGCLMFSSALLGQSFLGERAGWQNTVALSLVVASIATLTMGAQTARDALELQQHATFQSPWVVVAGAAAACLAGVSYAILGAAIRNSVGRGVPIPTSLFIVSATGVLVIGAMAVARSPGSLSDTPLTAWTPMVLAGIWNALAFLALTKCLETAPLYYTNALNASQIAMASIAGVLIFGEAASLNLVLGSSLTMIGLALIRHH